MKMDLILENSLWNNRNRLDYKIDQQNTIMKNSCGNFEGSIDRKSGEAVAGQEQDNRKPLARIFFC